MYWKRFLAATSLVLFIAGAVGFAVSAQEPPVVPRTQLLDAIAAKERHTDTLMFDANVVGVGVGVNARGRGVVRVLTRSADTRGIPTALDGVPVLVDVVGEIRALKGRPPGAGGGGVDPTARFDRPVPIGVSTGHPAITAGSIGCRVTDGPYVYALSNNHVYADANTANIGDAVIQPGAFDGGEPSADDIGTLHDFEPIIFSTLANNVIDAAIAVSSNYDLGNATPSDGYGMPKSTTIPAAINMSVMKYGRTTGQTKARVYAINATVNVGYDSGTARFVNQIIISGGGFSAGGDSGSLIVVQKGKNGRKPVGLLFAGGSGFTVANPIGPVLTRFGVTIDGE